MTWHHTKPSSEFIEQWTLRACGNKPLCSLRRNPEGGWFSSLLSLCGKEAKVVELRAPNLAEAQRRSVRNLRLMGWKLSAGDA
jgi:hypothetical protein